MEWGSSSTTAHTLFVNHGRIHLSHTCARLSATLPSANPPGGEKGEVKEIGGLPEKEPVRLPGRSPCNRVNYNRAVQISGTQATG